MYLKLYNTFKVKNYTSINVAVSLKGYNLLYLAWNKIFIFLDHTNLFKVM